MSGAQKAAWAVLLLSAAAAAAYFAASTALLPDSVAVRFDAAGVASSFMARGGYRSFIWAMGVALPLLLVGAMSTAYSRARDLRLPHREYWMAPARVAGTRAYLMAHACWFGVLLILLMSFVHHLIVDANRHQPPQLANQTLLIGIVALLGAMTLWIGTLIVKFRRPV
jgi:hypothetical protein